MTMFVSTEAAGADLRISSDRSRVRAPAPEPLPGPLGTIALLRALRANPVATWTELHFDKLLLSGESILARSSS